MMRAFEMIDARTFEEAAELRKQGNPDILAGGTDLINVYKHALLKEHPKTVINMKKIPDSTGIEEKDGKITIKALTTLTEIAENQIVRQKASALAQAAASVATPLIRNVGTIGGNICQDVRCWYYRYPHECGGRIDCLRKGGDTCYAIQGDNRYHSVYGGMKVHTDPCTKGCPAGTDIPAYMDRIRKGDWDGAARIIMQVNPMPMCTSRICPHPCQDNCNQKKSGECVSVHCVERTLGDYILEHADRYYRKPEKETGKKMAVVGAGPGGLTCAYYLRKAGHEVTVIDSHEKAGGVLQYGIPHYRLPREVLGKFIAALGHMGIQFRLGCEVGKDITAEELKAAYDKVYFGTGAWKQPVLGISKENLTEFGLDFLTEVNTYLKANLADTIVVCGGGNVAMDVALTAKRLGVKKVVLVCLEQKNEMPATGEEVARAVEEGVEIHNGWGLKGVLTDESGKVTGLESMKCTAVRDENGRFSPQYDYDEVTVYSAGTIILATGQRVDLSFLGDFADQLQTSHGLIEVDESYQTKEKAFYAGGDAVTGPNTAIRAIHAGQAAAKAINQEYGISLTVETEAGFLQYDAAGVQKKKNARVEERTVDSRTLSDEDTKSLSMEEAEEEARRCMNCGCYSVNASDIANVLVALGGTVVTTKKTIPAVDFFTAKLKACDMLDKDEVVKAVEVPVLEGYKTGYIKDRLRPSIDFALCSLAFAYKLEDGAFTDVSLVLGGAAPVPVKLDMVEGFLTGRKPDAELAKEAGSLAVRDASGMSKNHYKVIDISVMVSRLIESC